MTRPRTRRSMSDIVWPSTIAAVIAFLIAAFATVYFLLDAITRVELLYSWGLTGLIFAILSLRER